MFFLSCSLLADLLGLPDVQFEKIPDPPNWSYVTAGDIITYTLRCSNDGCDTARNIIIYDTLSSYFTHPDIIEWHISKVPPSASFDSTFAETINPVLPPSAWDDTIFNIPVLLSPTDPDVPPMRDTTWHILKRAELNIIKRAYELNGWEILPESSCVLPDSSFYYDINLSNTGDVPCKNLVIRDTIRNNFNCVEIDSIVTGPDSVWWHGYADTIAINVVIWKVPQLSVGGNLYMRFRAHILPEISKNEVWDTLDVLKNTCQVRSPNVLPDSSNTHILNVCYECGVEIEPPDTSLPAFVGEEKVCTLRVKNTGSFRDSISIYAFNTNPDWTIELGDTLFPDAPRDSIQLLPVKLIAPPDTSTDTAYVIATSRRSVRIGKTVRDTAIITITSGFRIVNIIVEPDTSAETPNTPLTYKYMRVINLGNDADVVDIDVLKHDDGWSYELTHWDGAPLVDTDSDGKIDVRAVPPNDTCRLLLKLTPPADIGSGVNISSTDTLVIRGTSSHEGPLDNIISLKDSAAVLTTLKIKEVNIIIYPNPFPKNRPATFVITLPNRANCTLVIYTRKGEVVRVLFEDKTFEPGRHEETWDARNQAGRKVAAETYVFIFKANGKRVIKKLVVLPSRY